MRNIILAFLFLIMFSSLALATDLSDISVLPKNTIENNKRAANAASRYASELATGNTAVHLAHLKKALNAATSSTQLILPADLASKTLSPTGPSTFTSAQTANVEPTNVEPIRISIFDRDPRYRANTYALVYGSDADRNRIWNGLPTNGYLNTVVIRGGSALCSGIVIAKNAVLTAQHCHCDGVNEYVLIGNEFHDFDNDQKYGIPVKSSTPMKSCGSLISTKADVALLILDRELDNSIVPATIASKRLLDGAKKVRAVGFGQDQNGRIGQKTFVDIPIASSNCAGEVTTKDGANMPDSTYYGCNSNFEFVAGAPLLNKDSCKGDSGGPVFIRDAKGNDYLAGTTSRRVNTPGARECGDGGIYVRTDGDVMNWIASQDVRIKVAP